MRHLDFNPIGLEDSCKASRGSDGKRVVPDMVMFLDDVGRIRVIENNPSHEHVSHMVLEDGSNITTDADVAQANGFILIQNAQFKTQDVTGQLFVCFEKDGEMQELGPVRSIVDKSGVSLNIGNNQTGSRRREEREFRHG